MSQFETGLALVVTQLTARKRLLHSTPSASPEILRQLLGAAEKKPSESHPTLDKSAPATSTIRILFFGEDDAPEPFSGEAGELLGKMIAAMGLRRPEVHLARFDSRENLLALIDKLRPETLVGLGGAGVTGLTGNQTPIGKLHGQWLESNGTPLMPIYHPNYLLQNGSITAKRKVWEDLLMVMVKLRLPISEEQRNFFTR